MTDIFITGSAQDKEIEELIKKRLVKSYTVTYVKNRNFSETGNGYNLIVFDCDKPEIEIKNAVLLMKENGIVPDNLPHDITAIINSDNALQLKAIQKSRIKTITCGMSNTSTISFSSETDDKLTVSLNRRITALSGKVIEPLEIPVEKNKSERYPLLCFAALRLLLDDFDSELGKLI